MRRRRWARNWAINGALVAIGLGIAFLLAEGVLRAIGFSAPLFYTYDDLTGSKLRAGAEGWFRAEGEAFVSINRDGLRDHEHARAKSPNTFRIALLGDSLTEALQVPLEATYVSVLSRELKTCDTYKGRDVEVINFGVAGYGTAQELLTFRHRASTYSPDLTILAFYAGNDVRNNSMALEPMKLRPFFRVRDNILDLDESFLRDPEYLSFKSTFEMRRSFLDLRTFQFLRKLKTQYRQWREGQASVGRDESVELGLDDSVFLPPATADWEAAWDITERLIAATRDEVVASGSRFLLVSIPIGIQVHPDPEVRNRFKAKLRIDDLWYPATRIRNLAEREKIDAITPGTTLESYAEANHVYLHGFKNSGLGSGHMSELGHQIIGATIAAHLCNHDPAMTISAGAGK